MIDQKHYDDAAARLKLGPLAIVVGLLRAEAADLRNHGRSLVARELERIARRLLRSTGETPPELATLDARAVVVSVTQGRGRAWR